MVPMGSSAAIEDARMVDVVGPGTDRAEVREDIPDFPRVSRDGTGAVNVGHRLTLRDTARRAVIRS